MFGRKRKGILFYLSLESGGMREVVDVELNICYLMFLFEIRNINIERVKRNDKFYLKL